MKVNYVLLICLNTILSLKVEKKNMSTRNNKELSEIASEFIKEYSKSFTTYKNSNIILVNSEKPTNKNNFIANYIYLENNSNNSDNDKDYIYFKVCVPLNKNLKPYLEVFCPFSQCEPYDVYLKSDLKCLKEIDYETRKSLNEISKFAR